MTWTATNSFATRNSRGRRVRSRPSVTSVCLVGIPTALAAWFSLKCSPQPTRCQHPALLPMLEAARPKLQFRGSYFPQPEADSVSVEGGSKRRLWLAVRWYGPEDGGVLVLNCAGEVVDAQRVGFTRQIRIGPVLKGVGPTVVVDDEPGQGTGVRWRETRVLAERGGTIIVLWKATTFEGSYSMPPRGTEIERRVAFSPDGDRITITSINRNVEYSDRANAWTATDSQQPTSNVLCWSPSALTYLPCSAQ